MKKIFIILLLLLVTGCGKSEKNEPEIVFSDELYEIALPYKSGVGSNYVAPGKTRYDLTSIDSILMDLSSAYFVPSNSLYQAGQYLTEKELKELLDRDHLNRSDMVEIEGKKVAHSYISYIYEQNYLASNNSLKGISLAIGLSSYVEYTNSYGTVKYHPLDKNSVLDFGKSKIHEIVEYLYKKEELKGIRIVLSLYMEPNPQGSDAGEFVYLATTTGKELTEVSLSYRRAALTSTYVMEKDISTYNNYASLVSTLRKNYNDLYVSGVGTYVNHSLSMVEITVNTIPKNSGEVMAINQEMAKVVSGLFGSDMKVRAYIKMNGQVRSMLVKEKNNTKTNIYLIGG